MNSKGGGAILRAAEAAGWAGLSLDGRRGVEGRDFPVRAGVSAASGCTGRGLATAGSGSPLGPILELDCVTEGGLNFLSARQSQSDAPRRVGGGSRIERRAHAW